MTAPLPLVLIPGRMSTETAWGEQIDALGQGRTIVSPSRHYRLRSMSAMARAIADELPERFDLAAWSMGGYIFFELHPLIRERLRRLVLIATSARPETEASRLARLDGLERAMKEGLAGVQHQSLAKAVHDKASVPDGFIERMHASALELGLETLQAQEAAIVARRDQRGMLSSIDCPTLIIVGDQDAVTPVECALELARGIAGSHLHILAGSGHCPPFERREIVNQLMREFLDGEAAGEPAQVAPAYAV